MSAPPPSSAVPPVHLVEPSRRSRPVHLRPNGEYVPRMPAEDGELVDDVFSFHAPSGPSSYPIRTLYSREQPAGNSSVSLRRPVTDLPLVSLRASLADPSSSSRVALLGTDGDVLQDVDLDRFRTLHDRRPGRGGMRMARPRRPDGSRPINPRTAAHTHEVTYDRDEEDEEGRRPLYQAIVLRSERQADDFGVRYAPGEHTALVVRFRRSIVTSRRRIDMEVSDFITVRRISDDKEERAVIKTFRQHRRYPKQKYCDTGVIECSRLDVVV